MRVEGPTHVKCSECQAQDEHLNVQNIIDTGICLYMQKLPLEKKIQEIGNHL